MSTLRQFLEFAGKNKLRFPRFERPEIGEIQSVCLRGARRFEIPDGAAYNYVTLNTVDGHYIGTGKILSQRQFRFNDIPSGLIKDNYDKSARESLAHLVMAMNAVYMDFDPMEIVTIVQWKVVHVKAEFGHGIVLTKDMIGFVPGLD